MYRFLSPIIFYPLCNLILAFILPALTHASVTLDFSGGQMFKEFTLEPHQAEAVLIKNLRSISSNQHIFCTVDPATIAITDLRSTPQYTIQQNGFELFIYPNGQATTAGIIHLNIQNPQNKPSLVVFACSIQNETSRAGAIPEAKNSYREKIASSYGDASAKLALLALLDKHLKYSQIVYQTSYSPLNVPQENISYTVDILRKEAKRSIHQLERIKHYLRAIDDEMIQKIYDAFKKLSDHYDISDYRSAQTYLHHLEFILIYTEAYLHIDANNWITSLLKNRAAMLSGVSQWAKEAFETFENAILHFQDQVIMSVESPASSIYDGMAHSSKDLQSISERAIVHAHSKLERNIATWYHNKGHLKEYFAEVLFDRLYKLRIRTLITGCVDDPLHSTIMPTEEASYNELCALVEKKLGPDAIQACQIAHASSVDVYQTEVKIILGLIDHLGADELKGYLGNLVNLSASLHPIIADKLAGRPIHNYGHPDLGGGQHALDPSVPIDGNFFKAFVEKSSTITIPEHQWSTKKITITATPYDADERWATRLHAKLPNYPWRPQNRVKRDIKPEASSSSSKIVEDDGRASNATPQSLIAAVPPKKVHEKQTTVSVPTRDRTKADRAPSVIKVPSQTPKKTIVAPKHKETSAPGSSSESLPPSIETQPLSAAKTTELIAGPSADISIASLSGKHRKTALTLLNGQPGLPWRKFESLWINGLKGEMIAPGSGGSHRTLLLNGIFQENIFIPHTKGNKRFGKHQTAKLKRLLLRLNS